MRVKIDRGARRRIERAGGTLTLEARAKTGACLIKMHIDPRLGKPEEPALFRELQIGRIQIFARGMIELPDGALQPSAAAMPKSIGVRERDGGLVAEAL